jgi:hypothetical protein
MGWRAATLLVVVVALCCAVLAASRAVGAEKEGLSRKQSQHEPEVAARGGVTTNYSSSPRPLPHHHHRRHLTQGLRGGGLVDIDGAGGGDPDNLEPTGNKIPRIIHLLWKTSTLPKFSEQYKRSWLENHKGWRVIQWTDDNMLAFVREHFPRDEPMWHSFPTGVFRADTFRYMAGGCTS